MAKLNLDAAVINGDTVRDARKETPSRNLWEECCEKHSFILISPEELINPDFRILLNSDQFAARCCRLGVDEVHLIASWGSSFRKSFLQLGLVRSRFRYKSPRGGLIPLIATSATIREGYAKDTITSTLNLAPGGYQLFRRSNLRNDIRIIVRELSTPITGIRFPDLDWTLDCPDNTVIFCQTIGLGSSF